MVLAACKFSYPVHINTYIPTDEPLPSQVSAIQVQAQQPRYTGLTENKDELEYKMRALEKLVYDWLTKPDGDIDEKMKKMEGLINIWIKKINKDIKKNPKGIKDLGRILKKNEKLKF